MSGVFCYCLGFFQGKFWGFCSQQSGNTDHTATGHLDGVVWEILGCRLFVLAVTQSSGVRRKILWGGSFSGIG